MRGGGRAASEGVSLDVVQLAGLAPAVQRRVLRYAAEQLGFTPDFQATETLRSLGLTGLAGHRAELADGLRGERTHRELRLLIQPAKGEKDSFEVAFRVPGEVEVPGLGVQLQVEAQSPTTAILRPWRAGDRVRLRHSGGQRKVKEVLERMKVNGPSRLSWPVIEMHGRIVWMQGVSVELEPGIRIWARDPGSSKPRPGDTVRPQG